MRGEKVIQVITKNNIVGTHYWKNAPQEFEYLSFPHRHIFSIRCWFNVSHADREIEINDMQVKIENGIKSKFGSDSIGVTFNGLSCEDIADFCIKNFDCVKCEVLEDGEGGAVVRRKY